MSPQISFCLFVLLFSVSILFCLFAQERFGKVGEINIAHLGYLLNIIFHLISISSFCNTSGRLNKGVKRILNSRQSIRPVPNSGSNLNNQIPNVKRLQFPYDSWAKRETVDSEGPLALADHRIVWCLLLFDPMSNIPSSIQVCIRNVIAFITEGTALKDELGLDLAYNSD